MKKILLAAVAALAITGCSQNEEFENVGQNAEMKFNSTVSKSVRAAEATIANLQSNGYKLYAYNTKVVAMADATALGTAVIDNKATYADSKWSFTTGGPYYWTLDENYQFFAYSPDITTPEWAVTGKYPSFDYTVKDVADQEDLLAATVYDKKKTSSTAVGDISLVFKHILTQVNFKLKGQDIGFDYNVTNITISDVLPSGKYTYDAGTGTGSWVASGTAVDYIYAATYKTFSDQDESIIATSSNSLMLMPQAVTTIKVTVAYSTSLKGQQTSKIFDGTKEVILTGNPWGVGQKILYTITLPSGNEPMNIVPIVGGWNAEEDGTSNN